MNRLLNNLSTTSGRKEINKKNQRPRRRQRNLIYPEEKFQMKYFVDCLRFIYFFRHSNLFFQNHV